MKVDKEKLHSAVMVLENYLDGALADLEQGDVENVEFIEGCVYTHKYLMSLIIDFPLLSLCSGEYEERFNKARKKVD